MEALAEWWIEGLSALGLAAGGGLGRFLWNKYRDHKKAKDEADQSLRDDLKQALKDAQDAKDTVARLDDGAMLRAEERFIQEMLNASIPMGPWGGVSSRMNALAGNKRAYAKCKINRIIIFCAINGKDHPNKTWSLYQWRGDGMEFTPYDAVDLTKPEDQGHYIALLKQTELQGHVNIDVPKLPRHSLLGGFYHSEGITDSKTMFMGSVDNNVTGQRALWYASVATDQGLMNEHDEVEAPLLLDAAKRIIQIGLARDKWKLD